MKKILPPLAMLPNQVFIALIRPLFSNTLMSPFDNPVYHKRQIYVRFHRMLKVILEMAFSVHYTPI